MLGQSWLAQDKATLISLSGGVVKFSQVITRLLASALAMACFLANLNGMVNYMVDGRVSRTSSF